MNRLPLYLCLFLLTLIACAWSLATILPSAKPSSDEVAEGKYLVEEVARCSECHTPRDAAGNLKAEAWLQGAPLSIKPLALSLNRADQAPPLAGHPAITDPQIGNVLEKGLGPNGEILRPPMHTYHLRHKDAQAIIAYLKSFTPAKR